MYDCFSDDCFSDDCFQRHSLGALFEIKNAPESMCPLPVYFTSARNETHSFGFINSR